MTGRKYFIYGIRGDSLYAAYAYGKAVGGILLALRSKGWKCAYRAARPIPGNVAA